MLHRYVTSAGGYDFLQEVSNALPHYVTHWIILYGGNAFWFSL